MDKWTWVLFLITGVIAAILVLYIKDVWASEANLE